MSKKPENPFPPEWSQQEPEYSDEQIEMVWKARVMQVEASLTAIEMILGYIEDNSGVYLKRQIEKEFGFEPYLIELALLVYLKLRSFDSLTEEELLNEVPN